MSVYGYGRGSTPEGFETIEPQLRGFAARLQELQTQASQSSTNQSRQFHLHQILRIEHERSRLVYDLYYGESKISPRLYRWLLRNGFANELLIARWKKAGFERLCCLRCLAKTEEAAVKAACICRVPPDCLEEDQRALSCAKCGCVGCSS